MDDDSEVEQKEPEVKNLDKHYFKQHPYLWNKPQKVVEDIKEDYLDKIFSLNKGALTNLLACLNLETLLKLLQINRQLGKTIKTIGTLQKFLELKEEYIENRGKPNQRVNFEKFSVNQYLKNNCELFAKWQKKYKMSKSDANLIFGELLQRQLMREFNKAQTTKKTNTYFNLNDASIKEYGLTILNSAIKDISFFRKIVISGLQENLSSFNVIKNFLNYSKSNLLSVNFSNNNFPDVIGANIFASIGIYCPNMQIIDISKNSLTYTTFNHAKVIKAFEVGFKKLSKLIIRNNLLGSKGFVNLCAVVKNAKKLNLLDVSYNGINKEVFENQNVVDFLSGDLQFFYAFYYEGNYLPNEEMKFFIKSILTNKSLTYLFLHNNQIDDESMELISFLIKKNPFVHNLNLGYNKFTSKGVESICKSLKLKSNRVIELCLQNNNLDETSLTYLSEALKHHQTISALNLAYNNFSYGSCGDCITRIIAKCPKLKHLNLTACHLGLKLKEILTQLEKNKTITFLDLSVNDIGNNPEIFQNLARMLEKNYYIKYLYLDSNYIVDKDFEILIYEGIEKNKNLKNLGLKSNKITLGAITALSEKLKKDTKKQLEQYLKYLQKPKKEINFFMQIRKANDLLVRDYKFLQAIEPEWTEKGILRSVKRNDHIKIIMLDDNPIAEEESLIKLNTILKFNGSIYPKLKMKE